MEVHGSGARTTGLHRAVEPVPDLMCKRWDIHFQKYASYSASPVLCSPGILDADPKGCTEDQKLELAPLLWVVALRSMLCTRDVASMSQPAQPAQLQLQQHQNVLSDRLAD